VRQPKRECHPAQGEAYAEHAEEGRLSNKSMKDNIRYFRDVPAYVRKNLALGTTDKAADSKVSKFTLTSGDDNEPVLRENNAYLNDNVIKRE